MTSEFSPETLVSPLAWLRRVMAADAAPADQEPGAIPLAETVSPELAAGMGGADNDPDWGPTSPGEAQEALEAIGQICAHHCPIAQRCPEDACRFYRLEGILEAEHGL